MQCAYHNLLAVLLILLLIKIGVRTVVSWTRERSNKHLIDFIRNGTDASPNQYPFFVGLHVRTYGLVCGGTLVRPLVILTAAHCRNFGYGRLPLILFSVEVKGIHYSIQNAKTHPDFDPQHPEKGNDLMLLHLYREVPSPDLVALNSDTHIPRVPQLLSLTGYGLTDARWGARPKTLQQVTDLLSVRCDDAPESWFHDNPDLICTRSGPSGANVCTFDSGSPLLMDHVDDNKGMIQVGIASLGDGATNPGCSQIFAAYTPVAPFYQWIQASLGHSL